MLGKVLSVSAVLAIIGTSSLANGPGESRPYQFRSANEFQVLLNAENIRLTHFGSGAAAGLGTQTGNTISISITGNGDNTIDLDQENNGDQTIQETDSGGNNSAGGGGGGGAALILNPSSSGSPILN